MEYEVKRARKTLIWNPPVMLVTAALMVWSIVNEDIPTLKAILSDGPVVRVYAAVLAKPLFVIVAILGILIVLFKAIPVPRRVFERLIWSATAILIPSFVLLVVSMLAARPLQSYYFPKHGYTRCTLLDGNPTIWFTDWVKNPEWCVKGKRREWVFEQARLAEQGDAATTKTR